MLKTIAAVMVFLVMSASAHAQAIVRMDMGEYFSEPNETLDAFMLRVAPVLDKFTAEKEWEACAAIGKTPDGQRYGFILTSSQAALGCLVYTEALPAGMVSANVSIHSHPGTREVYPGYMDRQIMAMRGMKVVQAEMKNQGRSGFSPEDFDAGPGYLVAGGNVMFQEGRGSVRRVGRLAERAPVRSFPRR